MASAYTYAGQRQPGEVIPAGPPMGYQTSGSPQVQPTAGLSTGDPTTDTALSTKNVETAGGGNQEVFSSAAYTRKDGTVLNQGQPKREAVATSMLKARL